MNLTVHNEKIQVEVDTKGAELTSIRGYETEIEYLWQSDEKVWSRHAPILFPMVGKLKEDKSVIAGKTYSMSQHGFARDMEFQLIGKTSNSVSLQLISNEESMQRYPYKFNLLVEYTLIDNKIQVTYKVKNIDDNKIYFSIGAHPGFNCPLYDDEKFEDYFLEFNSMETKPRYELKNGMFSGKKIEHLKNDTIVPISRELFKNDAIVYENLSSTKVSLLSRKHQHGICLDFEGFPYLGVWSRPQGDGDFVCIEPWFGLADFENTDGIFENKKGILNLEKDKCFECRYIIEVL